MYDPVFDLHCDTASMLTLTTFPQQLTEALGVPDSFAPRAGSDLVTNDLAISATAASPIPWLQCLACFIPDTLTPEQGVTFWQTIEAFLDEQVQQHPNELIAIPSSSDLESAVATGKLGVVKTLENARLFAADPNLVHTCAEAGLMMASLSWNAEGPLASGHVNENAGLTAAGRDALHRLEEERVIVDVSHLNDTCFAEVAKLTTRPFVASHSNARAVCGHPRNLTDDQFKIICERGGLVGLNYCDAFLVDDPHEHVPGYDDLCAHLEHWLDLGGEHVIALGSDFDGCTPPPCLRSAADMGAFQEQLRVRFGSEIARAVCGGNALAFFTTWAR